MNPLILNKPGIGNIILPGLDEKKATDEIVSGIISYMNDSGGTGVVIGLSGGVDSSLTAVLCRKAMEIMEGRFYALIIPSAHINQQDEQDAIELAESFGLKKIAPEGIIEQDSGYSVVSIDELDKAFSQTFPLFESELTVPHENMLSRCRMILLYGLKEALPGLRVAGTGNWDEDYGLGYFTKYGDGGVDFSPIGMLSKRMVYALAKYNNVPEKIIRKKPSAGLRKDQTDEEDLGCTYLQAEVIVRGKEYGEKIVDICQASDNADIRAIDKEMVERILHRHEKLAPHKLKCPPVMRVTFS